MLTHVPSPSGRRGTIINIASLLSFQGGITVPANAASEGGVAQLTKALFNEWASKAITVNAVAPGYVATEMNTAPMRDEERNDYHGTDTGGTLGKTGRLSKLCNLLSG